MQNYNLYRSERDLQTKLANRRTEALINWIKLAHYYSASASPLTSSDFTHAYQRWSSHRETASVCLTRSNQSKPAKIAPGSLASTAGLGGWAKGAAGTGTAGTRAREPIGMAINCSLMNSFNLYRQGKVSKSCNGKVVFLSWSLRLIVLSGREVYHTQMFELNLLATVNRSWVLSAGSVSILACNWRKIPNTLR